MESDEEYESANRSTTNHQTIVMATRKHIYTLIGLLCLLTTSATVLGQSAVDSTDLVSLIESVYNTALQEQKNSHRKETVQTTYKVILESDSIKKVYLFDKTKVEYDSTGYKKYESYKRYGTVPYRDYWITTDYRGSKDHDIWLKICRGYGIPYPERKEVNFRYDANRKEIETFIYQMEGYPRLFKSKYNAKGCIVEQCEYQQYKLISKHTYNYDSAGKEIEECAYNKAGTLDYKYTYQYDSNGNIYIRYHYDIKGNLIDKTFYHHYPNGNSLAIVVETEVQTEP